MAEQAHPLHAAPAPLSVVLVIGNLDRWKETGRLLPQLPGFHFTAFADVTADLLHRLTPALVVSALTGDDYDVIELARRLAALAYGGQYRVLTSGLPDAQLVRNEVHAVAPQIDFDLLDVQDGVLTRR